LGYRKNSKDGLVRGEQEIERLLFKRSQIEIVREKRKPLSLTVTDHNFPLVRQSKGQVLGNGLGIIDHGNRYHPVVIEVKTTNANPWFAVVENLIRLVLILTTSNSTLSNVVWRLKIPKKRGVLGGLSWHQANISTRKELI
jgi:hypothetical protein